MVEAIALDILERLPAADAIRLRDRLNALPNDQRRNLPAQSKAKPEEWSHAFRLLALGQRGLKVLSEQTEDIGHKLRNWRNYAHPGLSRSEPSLSPADGRLALGFAEKVIEEVEGWDAAGATLAVPP